MLVQVLEQIQLRAELVLQLVRADVDEAAFLGLCLLVAFHLVLIYNYIVTRRWSLRVSI